MVFKYLCMCGTIPAFGRTLEMLGPLISLKLVALAPINLPAPGWMGAFFYIENISCI
jgi:hypothetical protein